MYYPVNKMGRNASAKSNTIDLGFIRNSTPTPLAVGHNLLGEINPYLGKR